MRIGLGECLVALLSCLPATARAQGLAVEGTDAIRLLPPAGVVVEAYANQGYSLSVADGEVRVHSEAQPLESTAPYRAPARSVRDADPLAPLARSVVANARTRYDAVSRVLGWVSREIRYELDRGASQEPMAVLARHSGYCTGIARLSVALLHAAGIESREVAGWVAAGTGPGEVARFHRWIEVWYPDRGWVFSDPLVSHNWIPATYVRLASDQVDPERRDGGLVLERNDHVVPVDVYPEGARAVRARRNETVQRAGSLRVEVAGEAEGHAVLEGAGARWTSDLLAGAGTFVGLEPGRYLLRVDVPGRPPLARRIDLRARVKSAIYFPPLAGVLAGEGQSR